MNSFDIIIIGAGHNGLVLANYLVRCGLSVLVLERRLEAGGGLTTEEVTLPGFLHNLHSFFHDAVGVAPFYKDLDLAAHGLQYFCPDIQIGAPFRSGTPLAFHRNIDMTCQLIERRSPRDAKTYRELYESYADFIETIVLPALFSPPPLPSEAPHTLEKSSEGMEFLRLSRMSPKEVVEYYFEDEGVQALLLFQLPIPRGILDDYQGLGFMIPLLVSQAEASHICLGGSHNLAHALWRAFIKAGGILRGVHEVEEIVIEGGRAVGVITRGEKLLANKAVVSSVDIWQTFQQLLPESAVGNELLRKAKAFKADEFSVFSLHLALKEPPRYRAAEKLSKLNEAFKVDVGFETPADFERLRKNIREGRLPEKPCFYAACPTLFDPAQAPNGHHTAFLWQPAPYALSNAKSWDEVAEDFAKECLATWQRHAPNLTKENILGLRAYTPPDIEQKFINMRRGSIFMGRVSQDQIEAFRPFPECSSYRTPVENLYLCGAGTHPGGGILGACAYNCLQVMAKDLKLEKWWEK